MSVKLNHLTPSSFPRQPPVHIPARLPPTLLPPFPPTLSRLAVPPTFLQSSAALGRRLGRVAGAALGHVRLVVHQHRARSQRVGVGVVERTLLGGRDVRLQTAQVVLVLPTAAPSDGQTGGEDVRSRVGGWECGGDRGVRMLE